MDLEELNMVKETIKKEAEKFFREHNVKTKESVPYSFPYSPVILEDATEFKTVKLSNSTTPMVSF